VTQLINGTSVQMRKALIDFGRLAQDSDMAVIFYAGHGMEVGGENWLIPVDAALRSDTDAEQEAVSLRGAMLQAGKAHKLGLVILDACRNNPFIAKMQRSSLTRAVTRGLVSVEPTDNVLIAYAAKDGTVANDGNGDHSPFTTALLHNLETPGLEINFLFRNVRDEVMAATKREQQPFVYGSLSKDAIYLKPAESSPASKPSTASVTTLVPAPVVSPSRSISQFTEEDAKRVAQLGGILKLKMPEFKFGEIKPDVPASYAGFVGVWTSAVGFGGGKGRKGMLIVTDVMSDGFALGYYVYGDASPSSWIKTPAGYATFSTHIVNNGLSFKSGSTPFAISKSSNGELVVTTLRVVDGKVTKESAQAVFKPTWVAIPADHRETAKRQKR
jgi:hypothetical protein